MKKRILAERFPYVIRLPANVQAIDSIYVWYEIVSQKAVLNIFGEAGRTIRSVKPFEVRFWVGATRKCRVMRSSKEH